MSLSTALAEGRDHDVRVRTHARQAREDESDAWHEFGCGRGVNAMRDTHAARLDWAMAVCALLAWVRYGGES